MADQFGCVQALLLTGPAPGRQEPFIHFMVYPGRSEARAHADGLDGSSTSVIAACEHPRRGHRVHAPRGRRAHRADHRQRWQRALPRRRRRARRLPDPHRRGERNRRADRYVVAPRGRAGGSPGARNHTVVIAQDGKGATPRLRDVPRSTWSGRRSPHGRRRRLGPCNPVATRPGRADVRAGLLSPEAATRNHGPRRSACAGGSAS